MSRHVRPPGGDAQRRWLGPTGRARLARQARPAEREVIVADGHRFTALFRVTEGGGYVVCFPALPHLMVHGGSRELARARARHAVSDHLRGLKESGRLTPLWELRTAA